jgi:hypothetical protein
MFSDQTAIAESAISGNGRADGDAGEVQIVEQVLAGAPVLYQGARPECRRMLYALCLH